MRAVSSINSISPIGKRRFTGTRSRNGFVGSHGNNPRPDDRQPGMTFSATPPSARNSSNIFPHSGSDGGPDTTFSTKPANMIAFKIEPSCIRAPAVNQLLSAEPAGLHQSDGPFRFPVASSAEATPMARQNSTAKQIWPHRERHRRCRTRRLQAVLMVNTRIERRDCQGQKVVLSFY